MIIESAIILAAGEAKRLRPFSETNPKCFVTINNITILENALNNLSNTGVSAVYIVTGHLASVIKNRIGTHYGGLDIFYIDNPIYKKTNSMYSLYLGLKEINGATWVIEGDIFFEQDILLKKTISDTFCWFADSSIRNMDGAFIERDNNSRAVSLRIVRDTKLLTPNSLKSSGILYIDADNVPIVKTWLADGIRNKKENLYYDLIFADHFIDTFVKIVDISGMKWYEIDTNEDIELAKNIFK